MTGDSAISSETQSNKALDATFRTIRKIIRGNKGEVGTAVDETSPDSKLRRWALSFTSSCAFRHQRHTFRQDWASGKGLRESKHTMAEKVKNLGLKRDYSKYLYFLDKDGNVCRKSKSAEGKTETVVERAVDRDNQYLYFIDKDGDVSRSPRVSRGSKKSAA